MLKNIDPLLGPELLCHLRAMGHGDEVALVDANFPATALGQRVVRLDGVTAPAALKALLSVLPLDTYVPAAAHVMQTVGSAALAPIIEEFSQLLAQEAGARFAPPAALTREMFYQRARAAYLVVACGEQRLYGNLILTKGVIG